MGAILDGLVNAIQHGGAELLSSAPKSFVEGVIKAGGADFYAFVKRQIVGDKQQSGGRTNGSSKEDFASRLIEYLEHHDRALETTLQCLDQLVNRLNKLEFSDADRSILIAIGLSGADKPPRAADYQVQRIVSDTNPGLSQSIKSGYAMLHLCRGNMNLAEIYAHSALKINPVEAKAWYVLGLLTIRQTITDLPPLSADRAEQFLATAAEAGLAAQCALPRAALRFDHYKQRRRTEPIPTLIDLSKLYALRHKEAISWPYGILNNRIPTSAKFRTMWNGS